MGGLPPIKGGCQGQDFGMSQIDVDVPAPGPQRDQAPALCGPVERVPPPRPATQGDGANLLMVTQEVLQVRPLPVDRLNGMESSREQNGRDLGIQRSARRRSDADRPCIGTNLEPMASCCPFDLR